MLLALERRRRGHAVIRSYAAYVKSSIDSLVTPDGSDRDLRGRRNTTSIRSTRAARCSRLADRTHDPRYMRAADALREQLRTHPRTAEGGFWHKKIYPQQMWLDGLYMAEPFYAEYALRHGDTAAINDVARQFLLVARHLRDPKTGLFYHAWDSRATSSRGRIRRPDSRESSGDAPSAGISWPRSTCSTTCRRRIATAPS